MGQKWLLAGVAVKVGVGVWGSRVCATDVVDVACDAMLLVVLCLKRPLPIE